MTPQDFINILNQNHKVSQQFVDDAMSQNGWMRISSVSNAILFTDGCQLYFFEFPCPSEPYRVRAKRCAPRNMARAYRQAM